MQASLLYPPQQHLCCCCSHGGLSSRASSIQLPARLPPLLSCEVKSSSHTTSSRSAHSRRLARVLPPPTATATAAVSTAVSDAWQRKYGRRGGRDAQTLESWRAEEEDSHPQQQHEDAVQPHASLTRSLLMGPSPTSGLRSLTNRQSSSSSWRMSGPMSFLLFLFAILLGILATVRRFLVRKVKACKTCKAYGLIRCRLCDGQGSVLWRGKVNHEETCPLCLTKRYVTCPDCGGHYHHRLFNHVTSGVTKGPSQNPAGGGWPGSD